MEQQRFSFNDLVIYSSYSKPKIGRFKRIDRAGNLVIVPLNEGSIAKRKPENVIRFANVFYENSKEILKQVEAVWKKKNTIYRLLFINY